MTQTFKGDAPELQMIEAASPAFGACALELDRFYEGAFDAGDFLLMLYDAGRMPFADRVPRDTFIAFIKRAIPNARFTGSFESYLFLIKGIFGSDATVLFTVPAAGKLQMTINVAQSGLSFDFQARVLVDGAPFLFDMVTNNGDTLQFTGISGIDSQNELNQLLAELIPGGIYPDVTVTFFLLSQFVAEDNLGNLDTMVDHLFNNLVFYEV